MASAEGVGGEERPRVGVIGLGRMGSAIATTLSKDYTVLGWDVRSVEVPGTEVVARPEELLNGTVAVLSSLPSPKETRAVLTNESFRAAFEASDTVFVDASTSDPDSLRGLAQELGPAGRRVLDAPILGRPESCGAWTMPVGGDAEAFQRVRPVLEKIAPAHHHVGALGAGHTIKLLNNMMFAAINVITAEAIGACEHLDVDPEKFVEIVGGSAAATVSPLFRSLAPRMLGEDLGTVFTVQLLDKDLGLAVDMCREAGVPLISAPNLQRATRAALDAGLADADSAALVELYRTKDGA